MAEVKKRSFLVYGEDLKEVLDDLTDEQVGQLFRAMVDYHVTGEDPHLTGALKLVFIPLRRQMDRDAARYEAKCERNRENGKLGGRPKKGEKTERFFEKPKKADIDIDIDKDIDIDIEPAQAGAVSLSLSIIEYLNQQVGGSYSPDEHTVELISDLAARGYTEEQMRSVIDKKCADWLGDPKVEQYLRPSTLFGQKFTEYLSAPASAKMKERAEKKKQQDREMAELQRGTEALNRLFEKGQARHEQFMREHGLRSEAANE